MTAVRSDTDVQTSDGGEQPGRGTDVPGKARWLYRLVPLAWVGVIVGIFFALGAPGLPDFSGDGLESIEKYADEDPTVPAPLFTKFEADPIGANAWNVTLTLTDKRSEVALPPVTVTVTGTAPDGGAFGPVTFRDLGTGEFAGRVTGAPGTWTLVAQALASSEARVAPTQQSFSPTLPAKTTGKATSKAKSTS